MDYFVCFLVLQLCAFVLNVKCDPLYQTQEPLNAQFETAEHARPRRPDDTLLFTHIYVRPTLAIESY